MYINYAKKIILPVMVVVPLKYQYLFFLFAFIFLVVEFIFDYINGLYLKFSRLAVYKVAEVLTVVLLIIYYLVEANQDNYASSRAAAITCVFILAVNLFLFFVVELPLSIK